MDSGEAVAGGIGATIVAVATAIGVLVRELRKGRRADRTHERKGKIEDKRTDQEIRWDDDKKLRENYAAILEDNRLIAAEMRERVEAVEEELKQERKDHDATKRELTLALKAQARAESRIESLEDALRAANIPFRPFSSGPGSGPHPKLVEPPREGDQ